MNTLTDPRRARVFRCVRCAYRAGVAELVYAFDRGPELIERIRFPHPPALPVEREAAFASALGMLHLIAGVSYYKAGVPTRIEVDGDAPDHASADLLEAVWLHGLAEFAYRNQLDLANRIVFPRRNPVAGSHRGADLAGEQPSPNAPAANLPARTLVPLGGGKDSLVVVEACKHAGRDATVAWIGASPLIAAVAARTGLPRLNIGRELAPELFEYNRMGAWNGHVPVTAINAAILACAAILYGFDSIAFANERSASAAMLQHAGRAVNHQWSKGQQFEHGFAAWMHSHVACDLDCFSLLRPFSELAVTRAFARSGAAYFDVFSSCNRNFHITDRKPVDRWCGHCPKCQFVCLALAPFLPKTRLIGIFGRNLLDDASLAPGLDALIEHRTQRPFECVGEAGEARSALAALSTRPEWRSDALVARFREHVAPHLDAVPRPLETWLGPSGTHAAPATFADALRWIAR